MELEWLYVQNVECTQIKENTTCKSSTLPPLLDYKVVWGEGLSKLAEQVNIFRAKGYVPYEQLFHIVDNSYAQTIVLYNR